MMGWGACAVLVPTLHRMRNLRCPGPYTRFTPLNMGNTYACAFLGPHLICGTQTLALSCTLPCFTLHRMRDTRLRYPGALPTLHFVYETQTLALSWALLHFI
jgi:hypothetical protein